MSMEFMSVVEFLTQIITLFMLASGFPPCLHMYRTKDTKNIPFIFFLLGLLNALTGLVYGLRVQLNPLIYINAAGIGFNAVYILMYLAVCRSKMKSMLHTVAVCSLLFIYLKYLHLQGLTEAVITDKLGAFMFSVCLILLFSPVLEIVDSIKVQHGDGISRSMLYGGMSCCLAWLTYGILLNDFYIYAPNVVGLATNLGKVGVIIAYNGKSKTD